MRQRTAVRIRAAIPIGLAVIVACGSAPLPAPRYIAQPTSALVHVPDPPPPAKVELVPSRPADGVVWIDGEWRMHGRHWTWRPGRWVHPPAEARYSPWTSRRDENGTVYVANGVWRNARGEALPDPAPVGPLGSGRDDALPLRTFDAGIVEDLDGGPIEAGHIESFDGGSL